jgi:hypothetical protein
MKKIQDINKLYILKNKTLLSIVVYQKPWFLPGTPEEM